MARQISSASGVRALQQPSADDYKDRLIKMIPGEVVAAYLACNTAITQFKGSDSSYWIIFGILLVLFPFYLIRIMNVTDAAQIIIMSIAFILWTMTLSQPFIQVFKDANSQQLFSTLALTIYTFAVPIFYKGN